MLVFSKGPNVYLVKSHWLWLTYHMFLAKYKIVLGLFLLISDWPRLTQHMFLANFILVFSKGPNIYWLTSHLFLAKYKMFFGKFQTGFG